MKKTIYATILILMIGLMAMNLTSAIQEDCNLQVSLLNQDPIPAIPGDYVKVVFQISGLEKDACTGAQFRINPSYPFSLDEDAQTLYMPGQTWTSSNYKSSWTIPYTLRVASDALDGTHDLNVLYGEDNLDLSKSFNITVQDSRTSFDAVIQDASSSEVSIAIANIGKYTANSVVVRIPQQDNFRATDTDGQMVGSLDSGDYTIVSFALSQTARKSMTNSSSNLLQFDIYYTDALGERRVVNMDLPLNLRTSAENMSGTTFSGEFGARKTQNTSIFSSNYFKGTIIVLILVAGFYLYKKNPKKFKKAKEKINQIFHKEKSGSEHSKELPDWIKNLEKDVKGKKKQE
jgi:hypothetical protein